VTDSRRRHVDVDAHILAGEREAGSATVQSSRADVPAELRAALAGHYDFERELGRGGMATVYLAGDRRHERRVAVKVLDPALGAAMSAERFLREIRVTAGLTHPHILPLHDSGEVPIGHPGPERRAGSSFLYYVMPFVDGETLRDRLARGPLAPDVALRLVREVASALAYAHRQGVIHRDIKPANILLEHGHAVVADFGIARAVRRARAPQGVEEKGVAPTATLTDAGMALGTPAYMAPEQAVGDAGVDHRADLYALGVVTYEALAGAHPFSARAAPALVTAHLTETPNPLGERCPGVPPAFAALVMRCLEKDPAARPQSGDEIVATLDSVRVTVESVAAPGPSRPPRRALRIAVGAGVVLLALAGAVALASRSATREARPTRALASTLADSSALRMVAVLPFVNTGGTPGEDYFSDGLTDELAHALSRLPGIKLAGRTSSYAFKGKAIGAQEIGRLLVVDAIVVGTVRRAGDQMRVTTQLVNTSDGKVVLDSSYQRSSNDIFALQDDLTRTIVAALAPALGDRDVVVDLRGTTDEPAYDLYLKGHHYFMERGTANLARATTYFRQAISRDHQFARAYAALALVYAVLPNFVPDPADSMPALVTANAERALSLDSTVADAHSALGASLEMQLRYREALVRYRAAAALDPANATAHHWLGFALLSVGRTDEAIAELRLAARADPLALSAGTGLSATLLVARRFPEARDAARRVLALDSTFAYGLSALGLAQAFDGQPDSAVITFERDVSFHQDDARQYGGLLFAYASAGRWADAERVRAYLRRPGADQFDGIQPALAELVFGDREPLVRLLTSEAGLRRYLKSGGFLGCNPLFDPLWSDARFRETMRRLTVEPCTLVRPWPIPQRPR